MTLQSFRLLFGTLALTVLTACGGGSAETDTNTAPVAPPPSSTTTALPTDMYVGHYIDTANTPASLPSSTYLHLPQDNRSKEPLQTWTPPDSLSSSCFIGVVSSVAFATDQRYVLHRLIPQSLRQFSLNFSD